MNRCERSSTPFACGSPASRITQPTPSCPQNDGELVGRSAAAGDRALPVPHQLLRQRPDPPQAPRQTPQDVRRLLGEDQAAGDHPRPAQLRRHHPAAARLPVPDRDQLARLPQIALHQLTRPIDRPLKRPPHQEPRPNLTHIVIEDRLAALIATARSPSPAAATTGSSDPPATARRSTP